MEVWKDIAGYEGIYQISTLGQVKSLDRLVKNHSGTHYFKRGAIKLQRQKSNGYLIVDLYKDNIPKTYHVHRLVADAFIPNPDGKETVNHKDGIVTNNALGNLEWATPREQNLHFYRNGLKTQYSIQKAIRAMNAAQMKCVRCIETGTVYESVESAARALGRNGGSLISACCRGRRRMAYGHTWEYI